MFFYTSEGTEINKTLSPLFYWWRRQSIEISTAWPIQKVLPPKSEQHLRFWSLEHVLTSWSYAWHSTQHKTYEHTINVYWVNEWNKLNQCLSYLSNTRTSSGKISASQPQRWSTNPNLNKTVLRKFTLIPWTCLLVSNYHCKMYQSL